MKQLILFCALIAGAITAKAQTGMNTTECDMEIRTVCFNPSSAPACTPSSFGTWMLLTAHTALPIPVCSGALTAYQVRYATSTGCTGQATVYNGTPSCTTWPPGNRIGSTCPCTPNIYGPNVTYDVSTSTLIIDP